MGLPSGDIYEIHALEKNAVARSEISFVLQEGWRSLNWHRASSDIGYFLDKVSCVPDLKCHCVWSGVGMGGLGSGFCLLGTGVVGPGGEEKESGSSYRAGRGSSLPQTSKAPLWLRKRKLQ